MVGNNIKVVITSPSDDAAFLDKYFSSIKEHELPQNIMYFEKAGIGNWSFKADGMNYSISMIKPCRLCNELAAGNNFGIIIANIDNKDEKYISELKNIHETLKKNSGNFISNINILYDRTSLEDKTNDYIFENYAMPIKEQLISFSNIFKSLLE